MRTVKGLQKWSMKAGQSLFSLFAHSPTHATRASWLEYRTRFLAAPLAGILEQKSLLAVYTLTVKIPGLCLLQSVLMWSVPWQWKSRALACCRVFLCGLYLGSENPGPLPVAECSYVVCTLAVKIPGLCLLPSVVMWSVPWQWKSRAFACCRVFLCGLYLGSENPGPLPVAECSYVVCTLAVKIPRPLPVAECSYVVCTLAVKIPGLCLLQSVLMWSVPWQWKSWTFACCCVGSKSCLLKVAEPCLRYLRKPVTCSVILQKWSGLRYLSKPVASSLILQQQFTILTQLQKSVRKS